MNEFQDLKDAKIISPADAYKDYAGVDIPQCGAPDIVVVKKLIKE